MWLRDRRVYRRVLDNEAEDLIRKHGKRAYSVLRDGVRDQVPAVAAEVGTRFGIRTLVLLVWSAYWVFFIKILLPFSILSSYIGINELLTWGGLAFGLLAFILA